MGATVILQRRPRRAGAQVSLLRWLSSGAWADAPPITVCGEAGWLSEALARAGRPVHVRAFPSSRALSARLAKNRAFARDLCADLGPIDLVIGNDHPEGLLARAVARRAEARWAVVLRSFGASARDLRKYACPEADLVLAVGAETQRAASVALGRAVLGFDEGLLEAEFGPAQPPSRGLGPRVLVVGTPSPDKGWSDLTAAIARLEPAAGAAPLTWSFTADALPFAAPAGHRFEPVGRPEDFANLVRTHDLVVHPSRGETFGLAVAEAWAAGVPVLGSNTGVVPDLPVPERLRFEPADVAGLAARLAELQGGPPITRPEIEAVQAYLRAHHRWPEGLEAVMRALRDVRQVESPSQTSD